MSNTNRNGGAAEDHEKTGAQVPHKETHEGKEYTRRAAAAATCAWKWIMDGERAMILYNMKMSNLMCCVII